MGRSKQQSLFALLLLFIFLFLYYNVQTNSSLLRMPIESGWAFVHWGVSRQIMSRYPKRNCACHGTLHPVYPYFAVPHRSFDGNNNEFILYDVSIDISGAFFLAPVLSDIDMFILYICYVVNNILIANYYIRRKVWQVFHLYYLLELLYSVVITVLLLLPALLRWDKADAFFILLAITVPTGVYYANCYNSWRYNYTSSLAINVLVTLLPVSLNILLLLLNQIRTPRVQEGHELVRNVCRSYSVV